MMRKKPAQDQSPAAGTRLATVYYRLNRCEDGDRVRAIVWKLQDEKQQRDQPAGAGK